MNSFRLGLCSVTFRNKSLTEVIAIAKKAGVEYIEWGGDVHVKTIEDAKAAKELCDKSGIKTSSYGSYYNVISGDFGKLVEVCEIAHAMSASTVRVWLGKKDSEKTSEDEYKVLLANAQKMCDIASQYGLTVCPECHDNTFNNNTQAILRLKKDLDRENFKTYFQSRYFRMEYDLDRIDKTFHIIENVHVSYRDLEREQMFRKKDKNYLDTLLKRLREKGFGGIVMVEFVKHSSQKQFNKDIDKLKSY